MSTPCFASVPDLFGYGARGLSLAGGVVSAAEGPGAAYDNPAALSLEASPALTLGLQTAHFDLTFRNASVAMESANAVTIGFTLPLPLGAFLRDRLSIGGAFVTPVGTVLAARIPRPGEASFPLMQTRAHTVTLNPALGIRLTDAVRVGIGFVALAALDGKIDVAPDEGGRIRSQALDDLVPEYSPVIGVLLMPPRLGRLGVTYRGPSVARFDLPIAVNLGESFPIDVPVLRIAGVAQYDPAQWALGLSSPWWHQLRASLSVVLKRWGDFEQPIVYAAAPADQASLPSPGFHDVFQSGCHFEYVVEMEGYALTGRSAYVYAPSPVESQTGLHTHLDGDRHIMGLGLGGRLSHVDLNVGFQLQQLSGHRFRKSKARVESEGGRWDEIGRDEPLWIGGRVIALGIDVGIRL